MFKWLTDWLSGKTPDTNEIQVNPFPTTEKTDAPVNPQITDAVTQVIKVEKSVAKKTPKPKAEKKAANPKKSRAKKADK